MGSKFSYCFGKGYKLHAFAKLCTYSTCDENSKAFSRTNVCESIYLMLFHDEK